MFKLPRQFCTRHRGHVYRWRSREQAENCTQRGPCLHSRGLQASCRLAFRFSCLLINRDFEEIPSRHASVQLRVTPCRDVPGHLNLETLYLEAADIGMVAFLPIATGSEDFPGASPGSVCTLGFCSATGPGALKRALKAKASRGGRSRRRAGRCSH